MLIFVAYGGRKMKGRHHVVLTVLMEGGGYKLLNVLPLFILVILCCLFTGCQNNGYPGGIIWLPPVKDDSGDTSWYYVNPEASKFELSSSEQIAGLAELVNSGKSSFDGKVISLKEGVYDFSGIEWTGIGKDENTPFRGSFNGNGSIIRNLNVSYENACYAGFFGLVAGSKAEQPIEIKNIIFKNASIAIESTNGSLESYAGTLVGFASRAQISNISVKNSTISANANNIGGIIGLMEGHNSSIRNCSVENITVEGKYPDGFTVDTFIRNKNQYGVPFKVGGIVGMTCAEEYYFGGSISGTGRIAVSENKVSLSGLSAIYSDWGMVGGICGYSFTTDFTNNKVQIEGDKQISALDDNGVTTGIVELINSNNKPKWVVDTSMAQSRQYGNSSANGILGVVGGEGPDDTNIVYIGENQQTS